MALSLDKRVLSYIRTHPQCQCQAVQRALGLGKHEISQILYALEAKKLIQRTFSNPPLWCVYQKPSVSLRASESLESSNELRLSGSSETLPVADLLQPISLLNFIGAKFSLSVKHEEQQINNEWKITTCLYDLTNAAYEIKEVGDAFQSIEMARYSAAIKLIKKISQNEVLPFCSIAQRFMQQNPKVATTPSMSHNNSPTLPATRNSFALDLSPERNYSIFSPLFSAAIEVSSENDSITRLFVGGKYPENPTVCTKFRAQNLPYDFHAFQLWFQKVAWESVSGFVNSLACKLSEKSSQAKIVFGVNGQRDIQGIRISIPVGHTKQNIIEQVKEKLSKQLVNYASHVQPKAAQDIISIQIEEVKDFSNSTFLFVLVEVVITIPKFPTVCSVDDIFYYHTENENSTKMSLQQLLLRFTDPDFQFIQ